jgi:hypothetical protein
LAEAVSGPEPGPTELATGYAPGPIFYVITLVAMCLALGWASLPGSNVLGALVLVSAPSATWGVRLVVGAVNGPNRMSTPALADWVGIPALGVVCLALIVSGIPAIARFELSRSALDQAAAAAEAGETVSPGWIGLIPIENVVSEGDITSFVVAGSDGLCNLTHANASATSDWTGGQRLGGDWWFACASASADMP